ncbi:MAG: RecQ family zinc-binding domain-containing protein, partial [Cyanobacteria bacterium P01_A01_bin.135]
PSEAKLFYHPDDLKLQRFLSASGTVEEAALEEIVEHTRGGKPVSKDVLQEAADLSQTKLIAALEYLEKLGVISQTPQGIVAGEVDDEEDIDQALDQAMTAQERRKIFERSRLHMMRGYGETESCRRQYILSYFGEAFDAPCGNCDNCREDGNRDEVAYDQPFPLGSTIIHTNFGKGQVLRYEADKVVVLFETVGYKTFVSALIADAVRCLR